MPGDNRIDLQIDLQSDLQKDLQHDIASKKAKGAAVSKTDAQWRAELTPEQFAVTRRGATEPPHSGALLHEHRRGLFRCVCCGNVLFASDTKYESGCGWPSFFIPLAQDRVRYLEDRSHGMLRTEVRCARCDAHLGHVFDDGPQPTGQRYCMNSVALRFEPTDDAR